MCPFNFSPRGHSCLSAPVGTAVHFPSEVLCPIASCKSTAHSISPRRGCDLLRVTFSRRLGVGNGRRPTRSDGILQRSACRLWSRPGGEKASSGARLLNDARGRVESFIDLDGSSSVRYNASFNVVHSPQYRRRSCLAPLVQERHAARRALARTASSRGDVTVAAAGA